MPLTSGAFYLSPGPVTVPGVAEPVPQSFLAPIPVLKESTTTAPAMSSGQLKGTAVSRLTVRTPRSSAMALKDGVQALLLGHRIITNTTVPPMQAPMINFPSAGRHVNFPNKFRLEDKSSIAGST